MPESICRSISRFRTATEAAPSISPKGFGIDRVVLQHDCTMQICASEVILQTLHRLLFGPHYPQADRQEPTRRSRSRATVRIQQADVCSGATMAATCLTQPFDCWSRLPRSGHGEL